MNKFKDHENYISNPKGRKWSWGRLKFIGEFTAIDFCFIFFSLLITIPFWFFPWVPKASILVSSIFIYAVTLLLILETNGEKTYETLISFIDSIFSKKQKFRGEIIINENSMVFEILGGIDVYNLNPERISLIEHQFNDLFANHTKGAIKLFKFQSTLRFDEFLTKLAKRIDDEKDNKKKMVLLSHYSNIEKFKNNAMPSIYIEFIDSDEYEVKNLISNLSTVVEVKKIASKSWNSIKASHFLKVDQDKKEVVNLKTDLKRRSLKIDDEEYIASKISFGRNVPSLWLQELIFNNFTEFSINIKNPSLEEKIKIRKEVDRWSRTALFEAGEKEKNIQKKHKAIKEKEAKDNVYGSQIFGNDEIKYISGHVLFKKDSENQQSIRKQFVDLNMKLRKLYNFTLITNMNKQRKNLIDLFLYNEEQKWFPTTTTTVTYSVPFQNLAILEDDGGYLGYSDGRYPFVFNSWSDITAGKHTGIIAPTGGGKSILMQLLIANDSVMQNTRHFVLDPKNTGIGEAIIEKFGGETIEGDDIFLNPLAFHKKITKDNFQKELESKTIEIEAFLLTLFNSSTDIKKEAISDLADAIKAFYVKNEKQIITGKQFKFEDLKDLTPKIKFESIINKLTKGTYSRFNCLDTLNLSENKSYVFNLLEVVNLDNEISDATIFLILNKIIEEIYNREDKERYIGLWIDEAGDFLKNEYLTNKLEKLMVKARSFKTKIVWATQNYTDLDDPNRPKLLSILSNTRNFFFAEIDKNQIAALNEMFNKAEISTFTETEKVHMLDKTVKGNFLFIRGNNRHLVTIDLEDNFVLKKWIEEVKEKRGME